VSIIEKALDKQLSVKDASASNQSESQAREETATRESIPERAGSVAETRPFATENSVDQGSPGSSRSVELDLADLERRHFVSLSPKRRVINEEFSVIKRKLINNALRTAQNDFEKGIREIREYMHTSGIQAIAQKEINNTNPIFLLLTWL
jgi:hypothetical protein